MTGSLEYHQPKDWNAAWKVLGRSDVRSVPLMVGPHPKALADWEAEAVVDLSQLGLSYIEGSPDGTVHLGALISMQALVESPALAAQDGGLLSTAAYQAASPGMLNLASLGGTLYEAGGPPEVALALMVLDARIVTRGAGEARRELSIVEFLQSPLQEAHSREVIVEVKIPSRSGENAGWGLERVARTPRDAAIVAAAAYLEADGDRVRRARLSLAGASSNPRRFPSAEELLENQSMNEELLQKVAAQVVSQADPVADFRGSAGYRRAMAGVLTRRVIQSAWTRVRAR